MAQIASKYDLNSDEARVAYCTEASELLATLPGAVEREIYTARAAETAKIGLDAMKLEVQRALRRKARKEERDTQRVNLNPANKLQPKERTLRYENMRSARAEEGLLRLLLLDETLFNNLPLQTEEFSSPLLGRVFSLLWQEKIEGRSVALASLSADLTPEEMSHITAICQEPQSLQNAKQALEDYIRVIQAEAAKRTAPADDPLLAATEKYKSKKGTGGKHNG
jgi:DNA primase